MTDPLAGMTREQARAAVDEVRAVIESRPGYSSIMLNMNEAKELLALAARGAECVGAISAPVVEVEFAEDSAKVRVTCEVDGPHRFSSASRVLVLKEDR